MKMDRTEPVGESGFAAEIGTWLRASLEPGAALVADSRQVRAGDAFFAWPGQNVDGRDFIDAALAAGAGAVLFEGDDRGDATPRPGRPALPAGLRNHPRVREIAGLRTLAGPIAAHYHDHPSRHLDVIAVTGTNGKTTSTQWMASGFAAAGIRSAVIGTLGSGVVEAGRTPDLQAFGLTTPDALGLQRLLADYVARGIRCVALEASSIGIDQGRLNGVSVDTAVLTSLARDHLDYHGTSAAYLAAKLRLFSWPELRHALINGDDPVAPEFLASLAPGVASLAFGHLPGTHGWRAARKLSAWRIVEDAHGSTVSIGGDFGRTEIPLRILGQFNVVNALAAASVWLVHGMPFDEAMRRLAELPPLPGRMQRVDVEACPLVVVDYAHTPDALMSVLQALRPLAQARHGQLWCIFGAGGERDVGKRPLMAVAVERSADRAVVTSDNPRGETPFRIVSDIRSGFLREPWLTELDREQAIRRTIETAAPADVILIAGKGHETFQEIGGRRLPFSDPEIARKWLLARRARIDQDAVDV